ncbi:hypothetical protein ACFSRY_10695 [Pontibacter locisalis]|uniref:O-antigen ligase like membrane protein n=1 Tax=Pontibacter locisalis TaxID=1719035 RepID=A0ABW5ILP2_9BACT
MEIITVDEVYRWYHQIGYIGDGIISIVSIISFIKYNNRFPKFVNFCYITLVLLVFLASINDISIVVKKPSLLYSPKGVGTWINIGILYFAGNEKYRVKVFKVFLYICYFFIGVNLIQIYSLGSVENRNEALYAIRDTTINLIWIYPYYFFQENKNGSSVEIIKKYIIILLLALFAFTIASRSYLAIVTIFVCIKIKHDLKNQSNSILIYFSLSIILGCIYYFLISSSFYNSFESFAQIFINRVDEDSRSDQLEEFFSQYDVTSIITGEGPLITWNWSGYKDGPYQWLDNQFILIMWWFGLPTCIIYFCFIVKALFKKIPINNGEADKGKYILFFWVLACAGFAIYVTISSTLYYYFISLIIGGIYVNNKSFNINIIRDALLTENRLTKYEQIKCSINEKATLDT